MEAGSAIGHGKKDGTRETEGDTSMDKPFVSQWYWQEAMMHPYERTKVWYYGPREKWMKLEKKLLPLTDHYIPGITERPTHSEEMQDKLEPIDEN
tara:strand:- start:216 stop:500 length:285 start_codon:yes stop_codon:yes gene_type:complete